MSHQYSGVRSAFTLIELLLVLVILAVLAGIVIPKMTGNAEKSKITAAKTQISNFETALNSFEVNCGRYPTADEGLGALVNRPASVSGEWHAYMQSIPLDPWEHPYIYRPASDTAAAKSFDLISAGPDGQEGNADDIHN